MRNTKIIATLGPAMMTKVMLKRAIQAGVDVFRLNFSHGTHALHHQHIQNIREASREVNISVGILADLKGTEIRTDAHEYTLKKGQEVWITDLLFKKSLLKQHPKDVVIGVRYKAFFKCLKAGHSIFIDDGNLQLRVKKVENKGALARIMRDFTLRANKSINLPQVNMKFPLLSDEDKKDLSFIMKEDVDWIAASLVGERKQVDAILSFLKRNHSTIPVISKIETSRGLENLDAIMQVSEGIMVARGDLGVELLPEEVPLAQHEIIEKAKRDGKIIIIATEMLDSMIHSPRPTRAEATDVYHACWHQVDAVMLSGETATGAYPIQAINMMHRIITRAEKHRPNKQMQDIHHQDEMSLICKMSLQLAMESKASLLITISLMGKSPRIIASYRSSVTTVVACVRRDMYHRSHLYYSVKPILIEKHDSPQYQLTQIERELKRMHLVKKGDTVITMFTYPTTKDSTNSIRRWTVK